VPTCIVRRVERTVVVIMDPSEKERILSSLHADPVGGAHFGQTATIKKVTDRFWWRSVTNDVRVGYGSLV